MTEYNAGDARLRIVPDARNFKRDLEAEMKGVDRDFALKVTAEVARAREEIDKFRAEQEANPVKLRTTTSGGKGGRAGAFSDIEQFGNELGEKFAQAFEVKAATIGISLAPALAAGLVELAGAFDQLGAASVDIPGLLAGAGSAITTFGLGIHGVIESFKALDKEQQDTLTNGAQHAREAVQAQNELRNAVVDEYQAERDRATAWREARQELQDLNLELRGGQISEAQAILDAQKARQDLATGHYTTALDFQQARLRIVEADQRVAEAHQHNIDLQGKATDAQSKGVAGSDRVIAADQRLARSHEAVGQAQMRVNQITQLGTEAHRQAEYELSKMAPAAQEFVKTIFGMKGEFRDFENLLQGNLFAGMSDQVKTLVDSDLPTLRTGMGAIATGINHDFSALFKSLGSDQTKGIFDRIFGNTAAGQDHFAKAIDPIVHSIGTLAAAGTDSLPRLADGMAKAFERFDKFIDAADKDGRLDKWINNGIDGFTHLGNTLINLGQTVHGLVTALGGQGLLAMLDKGSKSLDAWVNSVHGQNVLAGFFAEARKELADIKPILEALPGIFKGTWDAAKDAVGVYLPVIREVAKVLGDNPGLVKAIAEAYLTWKTISPIVDGVKIALGGISDGLTAVGTGFYGTRQKAKESAEGVDEAFKAAGKEGSGIGKLASTMAAFGTAAGPFGLLAAGIVSIAIPALEKLIDKHNDAARAAQALDQQEHALLGTLDAVTNIAGLQTRTKIAQDFTNYKSDTGMSGNVLSAAASLGIGGTNGQDLVTAALPGGDQLYDQTMGKLRDAVRPSVEHFIGKSGVLLTGTGLSENDVIDAFLGVPAALAKVRNTQQHGQPVVDLGKIKDQVQHDGGAGAAAALVGQALNFNRSGTGGAVQQAQQSQAAAAPQPHLQSQFSQLFPNAQVNSDGTNTTIVTTQKPSQQQLDDAKKSGTTVTQGVPPNQDKWTWRLSADDARKYTYDKGGPTPGVPGPMPDGGYPAIVHPDEFVISGRGRATVPDSFLHALNQGIVDPKMLPHFYNGGPGDIADPSLQGGPLDTSGLPGYHPPAGGNPSGLAAGLGDAGSASADANGTFGPDANTGQGAGGVSSAVGDLVSGIQNPINNGMALFNSFAQGMGVSKGGGAGSGAGLFGLVHAANSPDPAGAMQAWGQQTMTYLANFGGKTLASAGQIAVSGIAGGLGLGGITNYLNDAEQAGTGIYSRLGAMMSPYSAANPDVDALLRNGNLPGGYSQLDPSVQAAIGAAGGNGASLPLTAGVAMSPEAARAIQYAQSHAVGQPYSYGGIGPTGYDCSGIASSIYAAAKGLPAGQRYFTTESDFTKLGFLPGYAPGALNIGVYRGGGGPNSHMALTLPNGINVESGGASDTTQYGGTAAGAQGFPLQYHLALSGTQGVGAVPGLYDQGGSWPTGTLGINNSGHTETVLNANQAQNIHQALNSAAANINTLVPRGGQQQQPQIPDVNKLAPRPSQQQQPQGPTEPAQGAAPPVRSQQSQPTVNPGAGPTEMQKGQGSGTPYDHNLAAVDTGIDSAAKAIGQAVSTAMGIAGAGAGAFGGAALGAAAPYAAGAIQVIGGNTKDLVNVGSSFLVGTVTDGTTANASGQMYRPEQNAPQTGMSRTTNYNVGQVADPFEMRRALDIRDAQQQQSFGANHAEWP